MSGAIFGGDEIGALVLDVGSYTTRAGFAGQDRPEIDIPTFMGFRRSGNYFLIKLKIGDPKFPNYLCGMNQITAINENTEIINPLKDGNISDWGAYEALLNHVFYHQLHVVPDEHPILISEQPVSSPPSQRENLSELLFEKFCVTALYMAKAPVLSSFAHGKSTSLVIDSGYSFTSVTPVVDGYALKKSTIHVPLAGSFLADKCIDLLKKMEIEVIPHYMVAGKETTPDGAMPLYSLKPPTVLARIYVYYEFPNGYYRSFADERYTIPELLFNPSNINNMAGASSLGVHNIAVNCALSCDVDVRSVPFYQLLNSIAVVGGTTSLSGYTDRLVHTYPGDRRFSSWVGGSILASMV
ncbi:hypothetical protein MXB_1569 [Myxobolus squamalis]|nr:hypothetical protein MXB_1569 [Myxobolus squamalis]